ncbi:MAG: hypothetical protein PVG11_04145 [Anaerolineae bacterium]|jgi:hypothetical protein
MTILGEVFQIETHTGEAVKAGDVEVIPESQALTLRWPGGGFVWNRPLAVRVKHGDQEERVPIVDITRVSQVALLTLIAVLSAVVLLRSIQNGRSQRE